MNKFSILIIVIFIIHSSIFLPSNSLSPGELGFISDLILINPQLQQLGLPLDDSLCTYNNSQIISFQCQNNFISSLILTNVEVPDSIGNLIYLQFLSISGVIGSLPSTISNCNLLRDLFLSSIKPLALPLRLCSLTTLNSLTELLYIPQCLFSNLVSITLTGPQPYFFSFGKSFTSLDQVTLHNSKIPPIQNWLLPRNRSSVSFINLDNCLFEQEISPIDFNSINSFTKIYVKNSKNFVLPPILDLNTYVELLDFSQNGLSVVPVLQNCNNLIVLNMPWNIITHLPLNLNCNQLREVDFSHNLIGSVPNWNAISSIMSLNLKNNRIVEFPSDVWSVIKTSYINLDLSSNLISVFPLYFVTEYWTTNILDISNNPIVKDSTNAGPEFIVSPSSNFKSFELKLMNLGLESLSVAMLTRMNSTLYKLDASQNKIVNLPNQIFTMNNLDNLQLSNNLISSIPNVIPQRTFSLLDLSNNKLGSFQNYYLSMTYYLDISNNNIVTWDSTDLGTTVTMRNLYLKNVGLSSIPSILKGSVLTENLDLSDNPNLQGDLSQLVLGNNIQNLQLNNISLTYFDSTIFSYLSYYSHILQISNNPMLFDTALNTNAATNFQTFESFFQNSHQFSYNLYSYDFSNTGLDNVFNITNPEISELNLSFNRIKSIPYNITFPISNKLNLSNNLIDSIHINTRFNLIELDLSNNLLASVPDFKLGLAESLRLDGNPLDLCNSLIMYSKAQLWPPSLPLNQGILINDRKNQDFENRFISFSRLNISSQRINSIQSCGCILPYLDGVIRSDFKLPKICQRTCKGRPPVPESYCNGTHWVIPIINDYNFPIIVSGPTILESDLNLNTTNTGGVLFDGLNGDLIVNGCFRSELPIGVDLTSKDNVDSIKDSRKELLITAQNGRCDKNDTSIPHLNLKTNTKVSCKKITTGQLESDEDTATYQLSGIFKINSTNCKVWWIVLISVLGSLVVISLITTILIYINKNKIHQFYSNIKK